MLTTVDGLSITPGVVLIKAAIDVDDILWDQNGQAGRVSGIRFEDLVDFHVNENPLLTDAQKKAMNACYQNPDLFRQIQFFPGAEKLLNLQHDGVCPQLNSNSFNEEIRDLKPPQLKALLPGLRDDQMRLGLVNDRTTVKKRYDDDTDIVMDDSPYNCMKAPCRDVVVPVVPWSVTKKAKQMMAKAEKRVHYYTQVTPEEGFEIIRKLAREIRRRKHTRRFY